jgi:hypothetical protein
LRRICAVCRAALTRPVSASRVSLLCRSRSSLLACSRGSVQAQKAKTRRACAGRVNVKRRRLRLRDSLTIARKTDRWHRPRKPIVQQIDEDAIHHRILWRDLSGARNRRHHVALLRGLGLWRHLRGGLWCRLDRHPLHLGEHLRQSTSHLSLPLSKLR